jgi:hypothetical protein
MSSLIIKNGHIFNKEGVKQRLEFGNAEQIQLIKEYNQKINLLKTEGVELHVDFEVEVTANAVFKCLCGTFIHFEANADDEDDISGFNGRERTCRTCGNNYKLSVPVNEDDVLLIKLIQK